MSLNASQNLVTTTPFIANSNSFTYYIYPLSANPMPATFFTFVLPIDYPDELTPITIINNSSFSVVIQNSLSVVLDTITQGQNATFIQAMPPSTTGWQEVNSGQVKADTSNLGGPIIPILTGDAATLNNGNWAALGSSAGAGSDFFNPFSTGGLQYWTPATTGAENLAVQSPITTNNPIIKGCLLQLRGATPANYFNDVVLNGANGSSLTPLYSFTNSQMQSMSTFFVTFPNNTSYYSYVLTIGNTVGTVTTLGIFNMQLFGYYDLST